MSKLLYLLFIPFLSPAQPRLSTPIPFAGYEFLNRKSIYSHSDITEEGSFLFPQVATSANVRLKNGRYYTNLNAMLNLLDNELLFQDSLGQIYTAIVPIDFIEFDKTIDSSKIIFKTGFPPVDDFTENTFYEVLSEGRLMLLKAYKISYVDRTIIQSSVPIRRYDTKETIYCYSQKEGMKKLSKNKKDVIEVLNDKNQEILKYIDTRKMNFKSTNDLADLFTFYNKL